MLEPRYASSILLGRDKRVLRFNLRSKPYCRTCPERSRTDTNIISQDGEEIAHLQLPECELFNRRNFLKQMLCKDDKILDINDPVTPWHRAYVT